MMAETDDPSPIFDDPPPIDCDQNTTDEIGAGDDLNESREDLRNEEQNTSTSAVCSDQEIREEELACMECSIAHCSPSATLVLSNSDSESRPCTSCHAISSRSWAITL